MNESISSTFLQGQIVALTYAIRTCIDHQPNATAVFEAIQGTLERTSTSMLAGGNQQAADGVERIRMALGTGSETND